MRETRRGLRGGCRFQGRAATVQVRRQETGTGRAKRLPGEREYEAAHGNHRHRFENTCTSSEPSVTVNTLPSAPYRGPWLPSRYSIGAPPESPDRYSRLSLRQSLQGSGIARMIVERGAGLVQPVPEMAMHPAPRRPCCSMKSASAHTVSNSPIPKSCIPRTPHSRESRIIGIGLRRGGEHRANLFSTSSGLVTLIHRPCSRPPL